MKFSCRRICSFIVLVYLVFSLYAAYNVFFKRATVSRVHRVTVSTLQPLKLGHGKDLAQSDERGDWNPWEEDDKLDTIALQQKHKVSVKVQERIAQNRPKVHKVQIWGKAAIGLYLWEHILEGQLEPADAAAQWREGELRSGKLHFSFYTGPAVVPGHIPLDTDSVLLVLNGREEQKISYATQWLQHVQTLVQAHQVLHVAVVLLGNEQCNNNWIEPYLRKHGGFVDLLFLVYDSPWVNEKDVYQWPLGVATYRRFPVVTPRSEMLNSRRPYLCNFLGTVYMNSSRVTLMEVLRRKELDKHCITTVRDKWLPRETGDSLRKYQEALLQSDVTLCPVGVNTECYRIYEACSYGSVPVVEDIMTPGNCGNSSVAHSAPLQLLKAMGAPFIFVKDWGELPAVLEKEIQMTLLEKHERRKKLVAWYSRFKLDLKEQLTDAIENTFFKSG
ncbi:ribitol-5-phosphate xylosyltransferase 1 isoform X1 [Polyodon spathula]|uniref:ribitol-5-phosphate xylosyltransferase 1 isoform X1 n=1 Tax=Polyodon spathula TaxID=7913 RepID=UPI001B7DF5C7|nr:ribitol-5-phosphate xylosyltransferase 1 isoform X1 [Polyodon spathula]